jgi:hypothetical protein
MLDAVVAAPGSHRVVFENERARVLEVMIGSGQREPTHTHRWPSVTLVDRPARSRYYVGNRLTYTSPEQPSHAHEPGPRSVGSMPKVPTQWRIDEYPYGAFRIEFKQI